MVYLRYIFAAFLVLWFTYFIMLFMHIYGKISITNRKITFGRMMVPFYYWIASVDEKEKPSKKRVKPIRKK